MGKRHSGSRTFSFLSGVLAFSLSAVMGIGFVTLVDRTHDLLSAAAYEEQTVVGTWQGKWHGVPSVLVTINRDGERLTGTVVFQAVLKTEQGPKPTGTPVSLGLKDASFDGRILRFKLDDKSSAHNRCESAIEMILTSANQAELRLAAASQGEGWNDEAVALTKTA